MYRRSVQRRGGTCATCVSPHMPRDHVWTLVLQITFVPLALPRYYPPTREVFSGAWLFCILLSNHWWSKRRNKCCENWFEVKKKMYFLSHFRTIIDCSGHMSKTWVKSWSYDLCSILHAKRTSSKLTLQKPRPSNSRSDSTQRTQNTETYLTYSEENETSASKI